MSSIKPTVLILHGAWHTPHHYSLLQKDIESRGYEVVLPFHLTCNNANPPNKTLEDDITQIRHVATGLVSKKKSVIVLMHSYGGVLGTAALSGLMINPSKPEDGGIIAMIYMCAFIPFENESLAGIFGGTLPPFLTPDEATGLINIDDPASHFYNDLPPDQQQRWVKELVVHPTEAQFSPVKSASWREANDKVWYLVCEADQGLPAFLQEMMCGRIEKEGVKVHVERCKGSHSPFLSMPEKVGELVDKVDETCSKVSP